MGIARTMTGSPWHVGTIRLSENEERRHRSRCRYYVKKDRCNIKGTCYGSSHCNLYDELSNEEKIQAKYRSKTQTECRIKKPKEPHQERTKLPKINTRPKTEDNVVNNIAIGAVVKHPEYGKGKVVRISRKYVTISFNNAGEKEFIYPYVFNNHHLVLEFD